MSKRSTDRDDVSMGERKLDMTITWYENDCFKCGEANLVCNGDEADWTQPDVADGFKCWSCGANNMIDERGWPVASDRDDDEHEEGMQSPQRTATEKAAPDLFPIAEAIAETPLPSDELLEHIDTKESFVSLNVSIAFILKAKAAIAQARGG